MPKKLEYESIKKEFKKRGFTLLDKEYKNNSTKMTFVDSDGYLGYMSYGNLMSGKRNQYVSKFNPHSVENIRHFLVLFNEGTTLLSDTYIDSDSLLEFQCKCGKTFERSWNNLKGQVYTCCSDCAIIQRGIQHRMSFDIVKDVFAQKGYTLVDTEHSYCRNNSYLECIDSDGYRGFQSYAHIQQRGDSISKFSTLKNKKVTWFIILTCGLVRIIFRAVVWILLMRISGQIKVSYVNVRAVKCFLPPFLLL